MESRLEELTRTLYVEGVEKAKAEGARILDQAKAEGEALVGSAKAEAARILAEANADAEALRHRLQSELGNAGTQALAAFRQELAKCLELSILKPAIFETLDDPEMMFELIKALVDRWNPSGADKGLHVQLPQDQADRLARWFSEAAISKLSHGLSVTFDGKFPEGFRISPDEGDWHISFSERELLALFQSHLKTRTRELLFPGA